MTNTLNEHISNISDADKNLVISVMNIDKYVNAILTKHLNNKTVYENLPHKKHMT